MSGAGDDLPTAGQTPPASPVDDLVPAGLPPEGLDPLADGILMPHQRAWVEDQAPLKLAEKGRRTGFTFAEALDSTMIAAAARSAGGDNTWYIGDTKDKGLAFIAVCARFARHIARELLTVEEFIFEDKPEDGESRFIQAFRVRFASGFQVAALSSNPANIRGLQGRVVIDEAAFHRDVAKVIDACNALLIWGGTIRIISTHNGASSAFAEPIRETRAGKYDYAIHRATFDDAVAGGLYERVCAIRGWAPTVDGKADWYRRVRRSYGTRVEAMREELDAIPREGEGVMLPLAWIEACTEPAYTVARWRPPAEGFDGLPEEQRRAEMRAWLEAEIAPPIRNLDAGAGPYAFGEDFGMRRDRTCIAIGYTARDLTRHVPLIVEFERCPYDQQKQALFFIVDRLPRFGGGILDANGNGMVLAQEARQKYGSRIQELIATDAWHREHAPRFAAAFEDRSIRIPADRDVRDDLRQFTMTGGVGKIPRHARSQGTDGGRRHADAAVALLNFHAATQAAAPPIAFQSSGPRRSTAFDAAPLAGQAFGAGGARSGIRADIGFGIVSGGADFRGWD